MFSYKFLWWCPQVYNVLKEHEKKIQIQNIEDHHEV